MNRENVKFSVSSFIVIIILIMFANALLEDITSRVIYIMINVFTGILSFSILYSLFKNLFLNLKYNNKDKIISHNDLTKNLKILETINLAIYIALSINSIVIIITSIILGQVSRHYISMFLLTFLLIITWYWSLEVNLFEKKSKVIKINSNEEEKLN